jgi:hypothetical protein
MVYDEGFDIVVNKEIPSENISYFAFLKYDEKNPEVMLNLDTLVIAMLLLMDGIILEINGGVFKDIKF